MINVGGVVVRVKVVVIIMIINIIVVVIITVINSYHYIKCICRKSIFSMLVLFGAPE